MREHGHLGYTEGHGLPFGMSLVTLVGDPLRPGLHPTTQPGGTGDWYLSI